MKVRAFLGIGLSIAYVSLVVMPAQAGGEYSHDLGRFATAEITPVDVAMDAQGNWWVLDFNLACLRQYAPDRVTVVRTLFTCGELGKDTTHLTDPRGLGFDAANNRLWIADAAARLVIVDLTTFAVATIKPTGLSGIFSAADVAIDDDGNAYASDTQNSRIVKLSPTGAVLTTWGSRGTGPGQFQQAQAVAYSSVGGPAVYVLDQMNRRVQKFTTDGTWLASFGSFGKGNGQMTGLPRGVAVDDQGTIYAGDVGGNRVVRWLADGTALTSLGTGLPNYRSGPLDFFYGPRGMTFAGGMLAVTDMWGWRIHLWSPDGASVGQIGGPAPPLDGHAWPRGVAVDAAGNVYVSDRFHQWIQKFAPDGTLLARWGIGRGAGPGSLNYPSGVDIDDTAGFIYIANRESNVIDRWRLADGVFDRRYTLPIGPRNNKAWPKDVAVNEATGDMYIADSANKQMDIVHQDGTSSVVKTFGVGGSAMGAAESIALDEAGNVYLADSTVKMVHVYSPTGVWLYDFTTTEAPTSIDVSNGNVYLVGQTVRVYTTAGAFVTSFGSVGTGDAQLRGVWVGIAVDAAGNIYIADTNNHRVKAFTPV